jgi:hypothetical protein
MKFLPRGRRRPGILRPCSRSGIRARRNDRPNTDIWLTKSAVKILATTPALTSPESGGCAVPLGSAVDQLPSAPQWPVPQNAGSNCRKCSREISYPSSKNELVRCRSASRYGLGSDETEPLPIVDVDKSVELTDRPGRWLFTGAIRCSAIRSIFSGHRDRAGKDTRAHEHEHGRWFWFV